MGLVDTLKGFVMDEDGKLKLGTIVTGIVGVIAGMYTGGGSNLLGALIGGGVGLGVGSAVDAMMKRRQESSEEALGAGVMAGKTGNMKTPGVAKQPEPAIVTPQIPVPNKNQSDRTM